MAISMNKFLYALCRYWDVESIPKHDLKKVDDDYFIDIQKGNLISIVITFFLFTVTVLFIGGGML